MARRWANFRKQCFFLFRELRKRLHYPQGCMKKEASIWTTALLLAFMCLAGCDSAENPLAPYDAARPFILQQVTQSFRPDIQWLGGRAAAVGVNRGSQAALDSTLVWLVTADDDAIDAPLRIGQDNDEDAVQGYGGTPLDSLISGEEYTFWIADKAALSAGISSAQADSFSFRDTTFVLDYALSGISGGDPSLDIEFSIIRNQTLTSDGYTIYWTPATVGFRRLALRKSPSGGFTNLAWYVVLPDSVEQSITSPVVLGQTPPGADVVTPWAGAFEPLTYTLWGTTRGWTGLFTRTAPGYAFFQIRSSNFN